MNINQAWNEAHALILSDYHKDETSTARAGYPVYRSDLDEREYICDLGDRLEVNFSDGRSVNLWYDSTDTTADHDTHNTHTQYKESEGITMTTNTNNTATQSKPATRPASFTKREWDRMTYDAFFTVVHYFQNKGKLSGMMGALSDLFVRCEIPRDEWHLFQLVRFMATDSVTKGERKVKAIASLRKYFNGAWAVLDGLDVVYKAPVAPKDNTPKVRNMSSAEKKNCVKKTFDRLNDEEKAALIEELISSMAA